MSCPFHKPPAPPAQPSPPSSKANIVSTTTVKKSEQKPILSEEEAFDQLLRWVKPASKLTAKDIVYIKEGWNKVLAFRFRLFFEALTERWFHLYPKVVVTLDLETEDMHNFLYAWVDLVVHQFSPETEILHRETFPAVHKSSFHTARFETIDRYGLQLAVLGVDALAMMALEEAWYFALKTHTPYFEDTDRAALEDKESAPLVRMFREYIIGSYVNSIEKHEQVSANLVPVCNLWRLKVNGQHREVGRRFYELLFSQYPDVMDYFVDTDMEAISKHLMDAVDIVLGTPKDWVPILPVLRALGGIHKRLMIPTWTYPIIIQVVVQLFNEILGVEAVTANLPTAAHVLDLVTGFISFPQYLVEIALKEADDFFVQAAPHFGWSAEALQQRKLKAMLEIYSKGTHELTSEELSFGAQLAWRNSGKCPGRIAYNTLVVRDCRSVEEPQAMFNECVEHQRIAAAGSNLVSVMTVFRARRPLERWGPRIWNSQTIRFAYWELPDGTCIGDPANQDLTERILETFPEWEPKTKTAFDILPFVIEVPEVGKPLMFEFPKEVAITVDITHPDNERFAELGYKWCVIPTITNFNLRLAGVDFVCCPFNGWYLDIEIARNLYDRYNAAEAMVPLFPDLLKRKLNNDSSWIDACFIEITRAVLHSFQRAKMSMVDRQTISKQFFVHCSRELEAGREVPGQWSWMGGLLGPVYSLWKHECRDFFRFPQYEYQSDKFVVAPWSSEEHKSDDINESSEADDFTAEIKNAKAVVSRGVPTVTILYGSETGTAESYAKRVSAELQLLKPTLKTLNDAAKPESRHLLLSDIVLVITSTFGAGMPPFNASKFFDSAVPIPDLSRKDSSSGAKPVKLAVCAIGSSVYPDFAAFGRKVFHELKGLGADSLVDLVTADEMRDQNGSFNGWLEAVRGLVLPASLAKALKLLNPSPPKLFVRPLSQATSQASEEGAEEQQQGGGVLHLFSQFKACPVTVNKELRVSADAENGRSTRLIEFDTTAFGESGGVYETGDHLAVQPVRPIADVERLCHLLKVDLHGKYEVFTASEISEEEMQALPVSQVLLQGKALYKVVDHSNAIPSGVTWAELLSVVVELNLAQSFLPAFISLLATTAREREEDADTSRTNGQVIADDPEVIEELLRFSEKLQKPAASLTALRLAGKVADLSLSSSSSSAETKARETVIPDSAVAFIDKFISVGDVLALFPGLSSRLNLARLLEILPKSKARYYSISSSHLVSPDRISITVGLMREVTPKGSVRNGVCSSFLHRSQLGEKVLISVRQSTFRLPSDLKTPVITVGPGTGLAPFVAFLDHRIEQARREKGESDGDSKEERNTNIICYTGARFHDDLIYKEEIYGKWSEEGATIHVAISGEGKKQRVNALMREQAKDIVEALVDKQGYYYCCGDARMADDANVALIEMIASVKKISRINAKTILSQIRESGRYQMDVWGLMTFFSKGVADYSDKRAKSAKAWLEMVQDK